MTTHMKRVITAFIAILFLIGVIRYAPLWVFIILILFVALLSLNEFYTLIKPKVAEKIVFFNHVLTAILFFSILPNNHRPIALFPFFVIVPFAFFYSPIQKVTTKSVILPT